MGSLLRIGEYLFADNGLSDSSWLDVAAGSNGDQRYFPTLVRISDGLLVEVGIAITVILIPYSDILDELSQILAIVRLSYCKVAVSFQLFIRDGCRSDFLLFLGIELVCRSRGSR